MTYYLDPRVTSVNRLPARARRFEGRTLSLNGTWDFRLFASPEETGDFYLPEADASSFSPISVPANWQLEGHGEPIYTNYVYHCPIGGDMAWSTMLDKNDAPKAGEYSLEVRILA